MVRTVAIPFWEAGWEVVALDINPQIEARRGLTIIHDDIRNVNPDDLGRFDAIWFSPPCERFSKANLGNYTISIHLEEKVSGKH